MDRKNVDSIDPDRLEEIREILTERFNRPISDEAIQAAMPGIRYRRNGVIQLTKLNGTEFTLNADLIETIEATPDSVIMLVTGRKYIVRESVEVIYQKCLAFKCEVYGVERAVNPPKD